MENRAVQLLRDRETELREELSEIRAGIAKLEGTRTGRPKPAREFSGISDTIARQVAEQIRNHNGEGVPIGILMDSLPSLSKTSVREGARKAADIYPDIIRFKMGREFRYQAKQAVLSDTNGNKD